MRWKMWSVAVLAAVVNPALRASADTVVTRAGDSYSGQFLGAKSGIIPFTDSSGIGYTFTSARCAVAGVHLDERYGDVAQW